MQGLHWSVDLSICPAGRPLVRISVHHAQYFDARKSKISKIGKFVRWWCKFEEKIERALSFDTLSYSITLISVQGRAEGPTPLNDWGGPASGPNEKKIKKDE